MSTSVNSSSNNQQKQKATKRLIIEVIIGIVIIALATLLAINFKKLAVALILKAIQFKPESKAFQAWLIPQARPTREYHFFNITNPNDIVTNPKLATIKFMDTPPYVYNLKTMKINVEWENDNTILNYGVQRLFTRHETRFNPSSVNDIGCFIDLLRATLRTQFDAKPAPAFYTLGGYNPFYQQNPVQLLEGFTSELFKIARDKMRGPNTNMSGLIYRQNGSRLYNVSITTDPMKKGQILKFTSELTQYKIDSPSQFPFPVYDGLTFPPMLFDKPNLNVFNSEFCKPILFQFNQAVKLGGINIHEYKLKLIDHDNCTNPADTSTCNEVNKMDVSKCISDSLPENTIFLSKAHFYGASNERIEEMNVEGFKPDKDKHESFIYFEPYTGTPVKVFFRLQINIAATIDPMILSDDETEGFKPKRNAKGVKRLFPIIWIDQGIDISDRVTKTLRKPIFLIKYGQYLVVPFAIILTVVIIIIIEIVARRSPRNAEDSRGTYSKAKTTDQN